MIRIVCEWSLEALECTLNELRADHPLSRIVGMSPHFVQDFYDDGRPCNSHVEYVAAVEVPALPRART